MKFIFFFFLLILLNSCSDDKEHTSQSDKSKSQWPASKVFTGNSNAFSISLSKELNGFSYKQTDTLKTIYDKALQDVYLMENDSISLTITVTSYSKNVLLKRNAEKLFESAMNNFIYALHAKSTKSVTCTKIIQNNASKGLRTFYTLIDGMTKYYGTSEMYLFKGKLYHIAMLTTSKESFSESPSIALAFHSFMPQ
jgi:hypothetical protein